MKALYTVFTVVFSTIVLSYSNTTVKIHAVTWNLIRQNPPNDLYEFLGMRYGEESDLIFVGIQNISKGCAQESSCAWAKMLHSKLTSKNYIKVSNNTFKNLGLFIYAKDSYKSKLDLNKVISRNVDMGMKFGTTFTTFNLLSKHFTIINSHLVGGTDKVNERCSKFNVVLHKMFVRTMDYFFWLGNLNFRVKKAAIEANQLISQGKLDDLLAHDQLKEVQTSNKAFQNWSEMAVTFKPSFKFNLGSDEYDLSTTPSWTDRILFKSETAKKIIPLKYQSLNMYKEANHKPVIAQFHVNL